jgi:hypothetical protein
MVGASFYIHKYDTYRYSNVLMAFNTTQEDLLWEIINILYGEHQAMYPRDLRAENGVIVGLFLYLHRYMQGKRLTEFMSHLSGYQMTARWKSVDEKLEEGKERLRLWHVESDKKD